jgi:hypothetical protein
MEMANAFKTELTHTNGNNNNNKIMIFFKLKILN